jgi:hypothetical protein
MTSIHALATDKACQSENFTHERFFFITSRDTADAACPDVATGMSQMDVAVMSKCCATGTSSDEIGGGTLPTGSPA